ncbi:hypothetical protein [Microbacterium sp. 16-032]|uniref:hypothetical protein n=1 Tax=Microbacterium sp. 16-032 TaxID=3239808 RepID=UPI0034E20E01
MIVVLAHGAPHIGLVVEGPGDKGALPVLLRKFLHEKAEYREILGKPVTLKGKGSATTPGGLEGYVAAAARPGCVGVVVLLDADDDASCQLGPELLARAEAVVGIPVVIVLAERDFEDWIYRSVETLDLGWEGDWDATKRGGTVIDSLLPDGGYQKPVWQPKLTHRMDIELARSRSTSLNRLLNKVDGLVALCS